MDYVSNSVLVCCILLDVFFMICPKMLERKLSLLVFRFLSLSMNLHVINVRNFALHTSPRLILGSIMAKKLSVLSTTVMWNNLLGHAFLIFLIMHVPGGWFFTERTAKGLQILCCKYFWFFCLDCSLFLLCGL